MNELTDAFSRTVMPLLEEAGVPPAEIEAGVDHLRFGVGRLALEMGHAESLGLSMHEIVRDAERFPTVHRFHLGVVDILRVELPPELVDLARRVLALPEPEHVEAIRLVLARAACSLSRNTPERALARLVLFEAVRMNIFVATWQDRSNLLRVGIDDEHLDRVAEGEVNTLIANADVLDEPDPIRPLHLLVAAAMGRVSKSTRAGEELSHVAEHVRLELDRRAALEEAISGMGADDALLIKNYFGPALGEQRLSVERLMSHHPLVFEGRQRNALDQRLRRRLKAMSTDVELLPAPKANPTLMDLFFETVGDAE